MQRVFPSDEWTCARHGEYARVLRDGIADRITLVVPTSCDITRLPEIFTEQRRDTGTRLLEDR